MVNGIIIGGDGNIFLRQKEHETIFNPFNDIYHRIHIRIDSW